MRFAVETHGCRLNQSESDALIEQLRARGHELVEPGQAELYLLNSCAITGGADADARAAIRRAKRKNPDARVVITGCHANAAAEALAAMPELDAVIGNAEKRGPKLYDLLERVGRAHSGAGEGGSPGPGLIAVERLSRRVRPERWRDPPATTPRRTRPLLKVQDGCDYQCSFCIVPSVRGRSRSASVEHAGGQLASLVQAGAPEVVLTGAHLGSWGRDLGPSARGHGLASLVEGLLAAQPSARLRLGSVDPHEVDEPLIELLGRGVDGSGAGLCQHIHLPVQSGDDGVLRAMRRAHRVADLDQLIPRLRARAPGVGLGTDVIVGFPGESKEAFERTLALFEALEIPFAHVFTWSPRSGTAAVDLPDRVDPSEAARRSRVLRKSVGRARERFWVSQCGTQRSAVVMRRRTRAGALRALTDNYIETELEGGDELLGRRVRLELVAVDDARVIARHVS